MESPVVTVSGRIVATPVSKSRSTAPRAAEQQHEVIAADEEEDEDRLTVTADNFELDECLAEDDEDFMWPTLIEKSLIIHKDENGFGLVLKGQAPVYVEHVHENGAAWRAGVRPLDRISRVNGMPASSLDHKEVVLMFKSCTRFVSLTLLSCLQQPADSVDMQPMESAQTLLLLKDARHMPKDRSALGRDRFKSPQPTDLLSADESALSKLRAPNQHSQSLASPTQHSKLGSNLYSLQQNGRTCMTSRQRNSLLASSLSSAREPRNLDPLGARTRESVSHERDYLSSHQLIVGPLSSVRHLQAATNYKHHHSHSLRGETRLTKLPTTMSNSSTDQQIICINCRSHTTSSHIQKQSPVAGQTSDADLIACPNCRLENFKVHQRHQSCGSMRDPRQQFKQSGQVEPTKPQFNFKLSQSASTNSLPEKEGRAGELSAAPGSLLIAGGGASVKRPATNKRLEIIREFIDTEKTHTDRLKSLDELFYRPLKAGGLMTAEQLRAVFSCHKSLFKIHREILRILQSANYNLYAEPMIGSALLEIFESDLKRRLERAACAFCAAQSTNTELLNKLTRPDTKVGEFLSQVARQQMVGRLGIKDLLASCFQRLTKYPLLLENLLKATPTAPALQPQRRARRPPSETSEHDNRDLDEEPETDEARNARRMLAISLAEEREFIERALQQSRQILVRVNESVKVAMSHNKLKEIWKRTDKYPGVPLIDITKQQVIHEGLLTLRLAKRSFDVYVLLLNDYLIILTREGQDKYRLKFFTPDGKSSSYSNQAQCVYSPVFVIDEHLTTRDAATDENGFYLLCKRKDDSRIYEFASRSPAERIKWRDRIQWTIERQMSKADRRASCESTITKSSSEISAKQDNDSGCGDNFNVPANVGSPAPPAEQEPIGKGASGQIDAQDGEKSKEPTKIEGTISYVEDDGIVMPYKMESSWALVEQAVQVTIFDSKQRELIQSN